VRFQSPVWLLALLVIPGIVLAWWLIERGRREAAEPFARPAIVPAIAAVRPGWRRQVPPALLLAAIALLLLASARPQARVPVRRERATVMLALDVSRSMDSTDIAPSRIAAARAAARLFLDRVPPGFRVGAVAFAAAARVISPPTQDVSAVATSLSSLETSRGTSIGDGLAESLRTIRKDAEDAPPGMSGEAVVLLLSDGNDTGSEVPPAAAAERAREAGVEVHTIALGDPETAAGKVRPPNVEALRSIAEATDGRFSVAPDEDELEQVYEDLGSELAWTWEYREVSVAFVGVAGVLAAACAGVSARWVRRVP
jgi:Ca-activated chloride channel family protein